MLRRIPPPLRETGQPGCWLVESGGPPRGFAIFRHAYESKGHSGVGGSGLFGKHMILLRLSEAFVLLCLRKHMISWWLVASPRCRLPADVGSCADCGNKKVRARADLFSFSSYIQNSKRGRESCQHCWGGRRGKSCGMCGCYFGAASWGLTCDGSGCGRALTPGIRGMLRDF